MAASWGLRASDKDKRLGGINTLPLLASSLLYTLTFCAFLKEPVTENIYILFSFLPAAIFQNIGVPGHVFSFSGV